jgi:endonuclease G
LPELTEHRDDIVTFDFNGEVRETLDYRHFSVMMSRERRLCFYSACNIDGKEIKRVRRQRWRFDPRIPEDLQIKKECYGNPPRSSRGHMTRRNDPSWGTEAGQGNADSMHVTNAVPQIQPFNGGIWLGLEDYALENAKQDDMRISVITGPFLFDDDPVRFGVKIPVRFWKVIAFIHDQTGELAATGYTMNQRSYIGEEEFVFGQHESSQRPIAEIERLSGISFGTLTDVDALRELTEAVPTLLTDPNQIRWR